MPTQFTLQRLGSDVEIGSRIFYQYCELKDALCVEEAKRRELAALVVDVARKLETAKYHRDNLLRLVSEAMVKLAQDPPEGSAVHSDLTTGVEREFEAFLIQGKSCLDVVVKILNPLFGIRVATYGDAGEKVIKALRRNLPKRVMGRAEPLIAMLEEDKTWIGKWFKDTRDSVTHYGNLKSPGFVSQQGPDGAMLHCEPCLDGHPISELIVYLFDHLMGFCEDFIPASMSIQFDPRLGLVETSEEKRDSDYPRKFMLCIRNLPDGRNEGSA
jgi:hypothetical protein